MNKKEKCQLCGYEGKLEKHHLVPQIKCKNKYDKSFRNDPENHVWICDQCHRTLHAYFDNNYLRDYLNTLENIKNDERFATYLKWRVKHLDFNSGSTKKSRK